MRFRRSRWLPRGRSATRLGDTEDGHPTVRVVCHVHPGTTVTNSYLGTIWWDNETDGERMYPKAGATVSAKQADAIQDANPEGAALRGLWSDPKFLAEFVVV